MNWTKSLPSETGYYWYRHTPEGASHVVYFDMLEITFSGSEFSRGEHCVWKITGEFWPVKIEEPK